MRKRVNVLLFFLCLGVLFSSYSIKAYAGKIPVAEKQSENVGYLEDMKNTAGIDEQQAGVFINNPDVNHDYVVDIKDLAALGSLYNVDNSSSEFRFGYDLNQDYLINLYDLVLASKNLGVQISLPEHVDYEAFLWEKYRIPDYVYFPVSEGYYTRTMVGWNAAMADTTEEGIQSFSGRFQNYKFETITAQLKVLRKYSNYNSESQGLVAKYKDSVIYTNPANNYCLSRAREDGTFLQRICSDSALYINVVEDWIYYVNTSENNSIYKIRPDGTERTYIIGDKAEYMCISDGWIYYSNAAEDYRIYKVRLDGSERTRLNNVRSKSLYIYNDEIYFNEYSWFTGERYDFGLCSIKKDGTGLRNVVNRHSIFKSVILKNSLYFISGDGSFNKIDLEQYDPDRPDEPIKFSVENAFFNSINSDGRYVYLSDGNYMYRHDPNEDSPYDLKILSPGRDINICGSTMFFISNQQPECMMSSTLEDLNPKAFGIDSGI